MTAFNIVRRILCYPNPTPAFEDMPAPILNLPVDVLCYIVDRISPAEAAALALSSKAILDTVKHQILRIEKTEDRVKLLKHLEVFFLTHILCYQCGKFHRRRKEVQTITAYTIRKTEDFISARMRSIYRLRGFKKS